MWKKILVWAVVAIIVVFVAIQFIPYGHELGTPAASAGDGFTWTDPRAEAIAVEACYDCHSDSTKVWWGVRVAPMSWLAQWDVSRGRSKLDFSSWGGSDEVDEVPDVISSGEMPPWQYWIVHPGVKLSPDEKQTLIDGFNASLAANPSGSSSEGDGGDGSYDD